MIVLKTKEVSVIARPDRLYITDGEQTIEIKQVERFIYGLKNYL